MTAAASAPTLLFTYRPLMLADVHGAVGDGYQVTGTDGDGAHIEVRTSTGRRIIQLDENTFDIDLELADLLGQVLGRPGPRTCYRLSPLTYGSSGWNEDRRRPLLEALAQAVDGIVTDKDYEPLWPVPAPDAPTVDSLFRAQPDADDIPDDIQVLAWRWYVRRSVCDVPIHAWVRALGRIAPGWLPSEYMGMTRMMPLDEQGIEVVEDRFRDETDFAALRGFMHPTEIYFYDAPGEADRYFVETAIRWDGAIVGELPRLRSVLAAVGDELGADLGLTEVCDNWSHAYGEPNQVLPPHEGGGRQDLEVADDPLAGLPRTPVWQTYLGPEYTDLLASLLPRTPAGWSDERTRRGRVITLGDEPSKDPDYPWLPKELCLNLRKRFLRAPQLEPARTRPRWEDASDRI